MAWSWFSKKFQYGPKCFICGRPIGDSTDEIAYETVDDAGNVETVKVGAVCAVCADHLDSIDSVAGMSPGKDGDVEAD